MEGGRDSDFFKVHLKRGRSGRRFLGDEGLRETERKEGYHFWVR